MREIIKQMMIRGDKREEKPWLCLSYIIFWRWKSQSQQLTLPIEFGSRLLSKGYQRCTCTSLLGWLWHRNLLHCQNMKYEVIQNPFNYINWFLCICVWRNECRIRKFHLIGHKVLTLWYWSSPRSHDIRFSFWWVVVFSVTPKSQGLQ